MDGWLVWTGSSCELPMVASDGDAKLLPCKKRGEVWLPSLQQRVGSPAKMVSCYKPLTAVNPGNPRISAVPKIYYISSPEKGRSGFAVLREQLADNHNKQS